MSKNNTVVENIEVVEATENEIIENGIVEIPETLITLQDAIRNPNLVEIKYIPFEIKVMMVNQIIDDCSSFNEDGMFEINYFLKESSMNITYLNNATNIDFSIITPVDAYNLICENDFLETIVNKTNGKDYYFIVGSVCDILSQKQELNNSLSAVVSRGINNLILKIPDSKTLEKMTKNMSKTLKNFSPEKMEYVNRAIETLNGKNAKAK